MTTERLLRELSETLGVLQKFARNEQAKDLTRQLLSPAADTRISDLIAEGLNAAEEMATSLVPQTQMERPQG